MLTKEELQQKHADLRAAESQRHGPKRKVEAQIQAKRAQIEDFDRVFSKAKVAGDEDTAAALKNKSNQLRDELADLEKILHAYQDGTLSASDEEAITTLGRELHHAAAETGKFFQAEHRPKLQAALELKKAYLAAITEIGDAERNALQCAAIVRETGRYVSNPVGPPSLRPNSITNFVPTLTIQNEEVFESYGQVGNWYADI